jgi:hypothetical protein
MQISTRRKFSVAHVSACARACIIPTDERCTHGRCAKAVGLLDVKVTRQQLLNTLNGTAAHSMQQQRSII